jgi:hypothetical protein
MSTSESNRFRVALAGLILSAVFVAPAFAADAKKGEPAPGSSVEMPYLIAPLTDGDTLVAYAYISCKIIVTSPNYSVDVRDKLAFIQDAFVRDVNAKSIGKSDSPQTVDKDALAARLLADTQKVMKPGTVGSVQLIEVQIRPTHPQPINPGGPS